LIAKGEEDMDSANSFDHLSGSFVFDSWKD